MRNESGYTLIEALTVILIIGILASIGHYSNLFSALLVPDATPHPQAEMMGRQYGPQLCTRWGGGINVRACINLKGAKCEKIASGVVEECINDLQSSFPPVMNQAEQRRAYKLSRKCIRKKWILTLLKYEPMDPLRKDVCSDVEELFAMKEKIEKVKNDDEFRRELIEKQKKRDQDFYDSLYD